MCVCKSSPCVGKRFTEWQFMQRGLLITLPASVNNATDRARRSPIVENAERARGELG